VVSGSKEGLPHGVVEGEDGAGRIAPAFMKETPVEHLVLVRAEGPDRFTARALGIPECSGEGATEADAVDQVRRSLTAWLSAVKVVRVEVPLNGSQSNPWLEYFGRSADDPSFADYLEELAKARAADPGAEGENSSP
jgi:hypothetical protein